MAGAVQVPLPVFSATKPCSSKIHWKLVPVPQVSRVTCWPLVVLGERTHLFAGMILIW